MTVPVEGLPSMLADRMGASLFWAATLCDVAVGLLAVRWRLQRCLSAERRPRAGERLTATVVGAVVWSFVLKLVALSLVAGLDGFGMIHLLYLFIVVTLPATGAGLLGLAPAPPRWRARDAG